MNGAEMFTDRRLLRALCGGFLGRLAVQDPDLGAGLKLVLPVDHDLLVGVQPGVDERLPVADLSDGNRPDRDRVVGIDDVRVGSFRTLLHNRCSDGQAVMPRVEEQPHVDELARPEAMRFVGKVRLELDRAGRLQDLIVDEAERALTQLDRIVLAVGQHRERPLGLLLLLLN